MWIHFVIEATWTCAWVCQLLEANKAMVSIYMYYTHKMYMYIKLYVYML